MSNIEALANDEKEKEADVTQEDVQHTDKYKSSGK